MGTVAVIGAGLAGSVAAKRLTEAGQRVVLWDKGSGPGGRSSTRRVDPMSFDHGAQYVTARGEGFAQVLETWQRAGVVGSWQGCFLDIDAEGAHPADRKTRWVGVPGMSSIVAHVQEGLDVRYGRAVTRVAWEGGEWRLHLDEGEPIRGISQLVLALPYEQAERLLKDAEIFLLDGVRLQSQPCWTLMVAFERSPGLAFVGARFRGHPCLGWIANNSSKPQRPHSRPECWVIQANAEWSEANLELDKERAAEPLWHAFNGLAQEHGVSLPEPLIRKAHRWRYAQVERPVGQPYLADHRLRLLLCGDWMLGKNIEDAYLSGLAAGGAALEMWR